MTDVQIVEVLKQMALTGVKVAGPLLIAMLAVGVVVSLFQTITQIQEQAVAYIAKFATVAIMLVALGPWMLHEMSGFVQEMWARIPEVR